MANNLNIPAPELNRLQRRDRQRRTRMVVDGQSIFKITEKRARETEEEFLKKKTRATS